MPFFIYQSLFFSKKSLILKKKKSKFQFPALCYENTDSCQATALINACKFRDWGQIMSSSIPAFTGICLGLVGELGTPLLVYNLLPLFPHWVWELSLGVCQARQKYSQYPQICAPGPAWPGLRGCRHEGDSWHGVDYAWTGWATLPVQKSSDCGCSMATGSKLQQDTQNPWLTSLEKELWGPTYWAASLKAVHERWSYVRPGWVNANFIR